MPLTTAERSSLVTALRLRAGISDTDPRIRQPAILVRDDGTTNAAATCRVTDAAVVLTGTTTGTDTLTFAANTTLTAMVAAIDALASGRSATLIAPDGAEDSANLQLQASTSILSDLTLYVESEQLLEQLVDEALERLETFTRTALFDDGTTTTEAQLWQDPGGAIVLDHGNVTQVDMVSTDAERALRVTYSGSGTGTIEVTDTQVVVQTTSGGTITESTDDLSGAAVADIVATIDALSDWTAETVRDGPATELVRMPPERVTAGTDVWAWVPAEGTYRLDRQAGVIHVDELRASYGGESRTRGQAFVRYRAGFATLPNDLRGVLLTVAKAGLDAQRRDAGLASERLGDYSWTAAAGSVPAAAMDEAMTAQGAVLGDRVRRLP